MFVSVFIIHFPLLLLYFSLYWLFPAHCLFVYWPYGLSLPLIAYPFFRFCFVWFSIKYDSFVCFYLCISLFLSLSWYLLSIYWDECSLCTRCIWVNIYLCMKGRRRVYFSNIIRKKIKYVEQNRFLFLVLRLDFKFKLLFHTFQYGGRSKYFPPLKR